MILWKDQTRKTEEAAIKEKDFSMEKAGKSEKKRKIPKKNVWLYKGICCTLAASFVYTACFGIFRDRARDYVIDPTASESNIAWLYESCYVLYRDLHNVVNETLSDYRDIYLKPEKGFEWLLEEQYLNSYLDVLNTPIVDEVDVESSLGVPPLPADEEHTEEVLIRYDGLNTANVEGLIGDLERFQEYFVNLEESFEYLNHIYGYHIVDNTTGQVITNLSMDDISNSGDNFFRLSFMFDEAGNVSVGEEIIASDVELIRRYANGEIRQNSSQNPVYDEMSSLKNYVSVMKPVNCTVTFCVTGETWENMTAGFQVNEYGRGDFSIKRYVDSGMRYAYIQAGAGNVLTVLFLLVGALGILLIGKGGTVTFKDNRAFYTSVEFLAVGGFLWYGIGGSNLTRWVANVAEGDAVKVLRYALGSYTLATVSVFAFNVLILTIFFLGAWYIGLCISEVKDTGIRGYIRNHSIIYRVFPYTKRKCVEAYNSVSNIDLTKDANKTIIWLLVVNGVILLAISSLWVVGWVAVVVYSLILYVVLRKYISDLQKRYRILLNATNEIAKGNLNVNIDENLGVFEPFKPEITRIQEGFKNAVEQEVKSQRMKSELITNVSHDLKTPLTAIITYINLLKEKNLTEEQRVEYLDTLERKSLRLKVLIEDLFEVSKASSHNVTLNIMDVDIMNLVKQVSFEMSDKLEAAGVDVRLNLPEGRISLPLDSQKTYRVYENLFGNIAKYAMPGTRVYVSGALREGCVEIILKNITAQEITVDSDELTERFVRNDASRNTEGSGLGLAIAKSFMEIQGGSLKVEVDGDLFKATTIWPLTEITV